MNTWWDEIMTKGIHFCYWACFCSIAIIICKRSFGKRRTCNWFNCNYPHVFIFHFVWYKWEYKTTKIAASTNAANQDIGKFTNFFKLLFSLKPYYRLM